MAILLREMKDKSAYYRRIQFEKKRAMANYKPKGYLEAAIGAPITTPPKKIKPRRYKEETPEETEARLARVHAFEAKRGNPKAEYKVGRKLGAVNAEPTETDVPTHKLSATRYIGLYPISSGGGSNYMAPETIAVKAKCKSNKRVSKGWASLQCQRNYKRHKLGTMIAPTLS